jgi:hypothetical protein
VVARRPAGPCVFGFHGTDQKREVEICSRRRRSGAGEGTGCVWRALHALEAPPDRPKLESLGEPDCPGQHGGRPIITALTMMPADTNMPYGLRSCR